MPLSSYVDAAWIYENELNDATGIVYCLSRKDSETVASELFERGPLDFLDMLNGCPNIRVLGLNATAYHAHLDARERECVHSSWRSNEVKIVVATNAFGLGINKPNVR